MNFLFHLYLADPSPGSLLGNLMGDFVKGPLDHSMDPVIRRGIRLHRRVDTLAHAHPLIHRSKQRIDPAYGHYRSIMVDIFYDHFLARNWERYSPVPLEEFAGDVYRLLRDHEAELPPGLRRIAPRMMEFDWLVSYRDPGTVPLVLERISRRLRRTNPMGRGGEELLKNYPDLEGDFEDFRKEVVAFVRDLKADPDF